LHFDLAGRTSAAYPRPVKSCQVKLSIEDSVAVFAGIEEEDVVEVFNCSLFKMMLKKLCHDSAQVKVVMTCCIPSKGTSVRQIVNCAGD
jgi:hypothetical protein